VSFRRASTPCSPRLKYRLGRAPGVRN